MTFRAFAKHSALVLIIVAVTLIAHAAYAQSWSQSNPTGPLPSERNQVGYDYDAANDRLIVYTGNSNGSFPNDAWVLMNATQPGSAPAWQQLSVSGPWPQSREAVGSAYDPVSNRLIVHGGWPGYKDTWVLTNANGMGGTSEWIQLPDGPQVRSAPATAYDKTSNRLIVFGGLEVSGYNCLNAWNDTWVLTNANGMGGTPQWVQLNPVGMPPGERHYMGSAYDPVSNRLIVHGGGDCTGSFDDLWVLTNANGMGGTPQWIQMNPPAGPSERSTHRMVYSPVSKKALIYGGVSATMSHGTNEVWLLRHADGTTGTPQWTQLAPSGSDPGFNTAYAAGYSPTADAFVAALGLNRYGTGYRNETWVLEDAGLTPDDDPPVCDQASAVPNRLWPSSHTLIPVSIAGVTDPNGDPVTIAVTGITQDESVSGLSEDDRSPDGVIMGATAQIRAERSGEGDGRVYRINFTADDGRGGMCSGAVGVGVPHNSKKTPIDSGQSYDSMQP
jgi:hypothetical protein